MRHRRRLRHEADDLASRYGMKRGVEPLHSKIERALVPEDAAQGAAVAQAEGNGLRGAWFSQRPLDLDSPSFPRQIGEIGTENAASAPHHVAARAVALPGEEPFAGRGIAGDRVIRRRRSQHFDEGHKRIELGVGHGERRHRRIGNAVADQVAHRRPRAGAWPADVDKRRAVAAAGAVGPVAADAARLVDLPAGLQRLRECAGIRGRERHDQAEKGSRRVTRHDESLNPGDEDPCDLAHPALERPVGCGLALLGSGGWIRPVRQPQLRYLNGLGVIVWPQCPDP